MHRDRERENERKVTVPNYVKIDGSLGEGGGQILRTAVSLASITGRPVEVTNIRSKRANPGLRPQHLTGIQILAELFGAKTENLCVGADWIRFTPSDRFQGGTKQVDIGTAGSIPMILLTVVPAVALSKNQLELQVTGGTDVRASPTIDYLRYVIQQAYGSIGIKFSVDVIKRGYYPKGGGVVKTVIQPAGRPEPMDLTRERKFEPRIASVCCQLPRHVAERQTTSALIALEKKGIRCRNYTASIETALSPGSSIVVYSSSDFGPYVGGDSIGEIGKRAEAVGTEAAGRFLESAIAGAPVDSYLADMLVLPLALARGRSRYKIARVTKHLETNLQVASRIVAGCRHELIPQQDGTFIVELDAQA